MVGVQGTAMDMVKKYALRTAGWLKVPTFLSVIYAAFDNPADTFNPYRLVAGTLMLSTVLILAMFGKKKEGELTDEQKATAAQLEAKGFMGEIQKVFHPKDYPIEAAGGIGIVGSAFTLLSGAFGAPSIIAAEMAIGAFAIPASLFLWISRDKKDVTTETTKTAESAAESLTFATSESKTVGGTNGFSAFIKNEILGKPVRTASILFLGASAMQLTVGFNLLGQSEGLDLGFIMAGVFSGISNILSLLFVRKSDYNIEQDEHEKTPDTKVHERVAKSEILALPEAALGVA